MRRQLGGRRVPACGRERLTRTALLGVLAGTGLAGLAGCGATKEDVVRLETASQDQNARLRQDLSTVRQSLEQLSAALRQLRADLDAGFDELNNRMGIVESLMRDNEQMFQRFQRRLQESQERQRRAAADTAGTAIATPEVPPGGGEAGVEETGGGRTPPPAAVPSEIDLYNGALNDYQARRYDLALAGFREYLRLYPDGTSPDNAQFWIGKIYLDQEQYEAALQELEQLLAAYPETDKAAQATFYLGNANRALGNEERARAYYRDVIERYPASQEAQLARRELDR